MVRQVILPALIFLSTGLATPLLSREAKDTVVHSPPDEYPKVKGTMYLNIIWHQHQPIYLDPSKDQLQAPWVRAYATKDYYDMAAILRGYPDVHVTINLSSSLLHQLQKYYVERLEPYVDIDQNRVNTKRYFATYGGKTDPWIDILLKETKDLDEQDLTYLLKNPWNFFSINEIMIHRFPQYLTLRDKPEEEYTEQDLREIKLFHFLAWMDPDFLRANAMLPLEHSVDLSDLVEEIEPGVFTLRKRITEEDCQRMLAEVYKVMANVIPIHRSLIYDADERSGQIEVITTPFSHPVLPLIYDSDIAKICQPKDELPTRYSFPDDARAQVEKAVQLYIKAFRLAPTGICAREGSAAHETIAILCASGIQWTASTDAILFQSRPQGLSLHRPYAVGRGKDRIAVVFRDTPLSEKILLRYRDYCGEEAADDFIRSVLHYAPPEGEPDRLLSVIVDGEYAWEWYKKDVDGKDFLHALYRKLEKLHRTHQIVTVTPTEYVTGNPKRGIPPHPVESLTTVDHLWPGSCSSPDYSPWIGEHEENLAWEYLLNARVALQNSGIPPPSPLDAPPKPHTKEWYRWMAWEAMYTAQSSDWFFWYGADENSPGGDERFDRLYLTHLSNIYEFASQYGASIEKPELEPIISPIGERTYAQKRITVTFQCDAKGRDIAHAIYIMGNKLELANWAPDRVSMYDDGTHGDTSSGDGIWSLAFAFPEGAWIEYRYVNSGRDEASGTKGSAVAKRILIVSDPDGDGKQVVRDVFGVIE